MWYVSRSLAAQLPHDNPDSQNQDDSNRAEAIVTVGCGPDGVVGNEPTFTYHITPDGLSIDRCTDDGNHLGGVDLDLTMLNAICGVGFMQPSEVIAARARLFPDYEGRLVCEDELAAQVEQVRFAALGALKGEERSTLTELAPALLSVLDALATRTAKLEQQAAGCGARCAGPRKKDGTLVRRMKMHPATEAYSSEQLAQRMMQICGCQGEHACDCVTVRNQASTELWTEYNVGKRAR